MREYAIRIHKVEPSFLLLKALGFLIKKQQKLGLPAEAILPYPDAKAILSSMMHLSKDESFIVIRELIAFGHIKNVNNHGIRIIKKGSFDSQKNSDEVSTPMTLHEP